jgi:hypothetical protein
VRDPARRLTLNTAAQANPGGSRHAIVSQVKRQTPGVDEPEEHARRDTARLLTAPIAVVGVRAASARSGRPAQA